MSILPIAAFIGGIILGVINTAHLVYSVRTHSPGYIEREGILKRIPVVIAFFLISAVIGALLFYLHWEGLVSGVRTFLLLIPMSLTYFLSVIPSSLRLILYFFGFLIGILGYIFRKSRTSFTLMAVSVLFWVIMNIALMQTIAIT